MIRINKAPRVLMVDPPVLDREASQTLARQKERIDKAHNLFDGPILMCKQASPEKFELFPATYSWLLSYYQDPENSPFGKGAVGVSVMAHAQGEYLWTKRADDLLLCPGDWDFAASGAVDPGEDFVAAAKREMFEETGLEPYEISYHSLLLGPRFGGCTILFEAKMHKQTPTLDPSEVSDFVWSRTAPPLVGGAKEMWAFYQSFA